MPPKNALIMEVIIMNAVNKLPKDSPLRLFVEDELGFYKKYFRHFNSSVTREKKILLFENPNRIRVTYEFDVQKLPNTDVLLFIFLPDTRKNWLRLSWKGQRLTVTPAEEIKNAVWEVVKDDVIKVFDALYEPDKDVLWDKKIWGGRTQLPCFVNGTQVAGDGQLVVEYYDSFESFDHIGCLFDERRYTYHYTLEAGKSHWLYVKAPEKFQIDLTTKDKRANVIKGNDPEIKAYRIHHGTNNVPVKFNVDIKVPRSLKLWYRALVGLGVVYILCFIAVFYAAIKSDLTIKEFSPVYAQVGISIIAAIIATRGWLMNEETVLGRVSKWFTWIVIVIVALLVGGYSFLMLR